MNLLLFVWLTIALTAVKTVNAKDQKYNAEEIILKKNDAVEICSNTHQISQDAIKEIMNNLHVVEDQEVKCWLSCVAKKIGVIVEGKIDWELCSFISKLDLVKDEDKTKVDVISQICQAEVPQDEKDECQLAYLAVACKIKNWNELGLPNGN